MHDVPDILDLEKRLGRIEQRLVLEEAADVRPAFHPAWPLALGLIAIVLGCLGVGLPGHYYQVLFSVLLLLLLYHRGSLVLMPGKWKWPLILVNFLLLCLLFQLLIGGGIPVYFVRASTTSSTGTTTTNSFTALGDIYGQVRLSFPNPFLNFKTQFTGRAPTGSTSDGISSGHATYDWTNRIDRSFGLATPFFEAGIADSLPDAFVYRRSFASYGNLAHFQAGLEYNFFDWLGAAVSAFDVAPWGTQTVYSRGMGGGNGGGPPSGHGPPFLGSPQLTGGTSLAADNGFSAGIDIAPTRAFDFTVGYSRSTHYNLNTVSFGIAVNMRQILRAPSL